MSDIYTRPGATPPPPPGPVTRPMPPYYPRPEPAPTPDDPYTRPTTPGPQQGPPPGQGGGRGPTGGKPVDPDAGVSEDFLTNLRREFPWMTEPMITIYVEAWIVTGDATTALWEVRESQAYRNKFPAMFHTEGPEAGMMRYDDEAEYLTVQGDFRDALADYEQNPDAYADRITKSMQGNVSPDEFRARLQLLWDGVVQQIPQIRAAYVREFGLHDADPAVRDANIFGSLLNPDMSLNEVKVAVTNASIVGQGAAFGFRRSWDRAEELRLAGLTGEAARGLYEQAAVQTPTLSNLAARYFDPDDTFGIDDFEEMATGLDPFEAERAQNLIRLERASFSGGGQVARDQTGALSGLQQS